MPNLMPPVPMGDRLLRRRRPQPVTMEADAEAAFPAPPDDVTQPQEPPPPPQDVVTSHRRRRPIRADHEANMESMYNHHNAPPEEHNEKSYVRTRSGSRDSTVGNMFNDISSSRQRQIRSDSNLVQQQQNHNVPQSHHQSSSNPQQYGTNSNNLNSAFLKTRARFAKQNQYSQDDDSKLHAQQMPLQRTSRSRSQPAVHHLHNMNNGELQPASRCVLFILSQMVFLRQVTL